jgi:hypothetical protein
LDGSGAVEVVDEPGSLSGEEFESGFDAAADTRVSSFVKQDCFLVLQELFDIGLVSHSGQWSTHKTLK